MGQVAIPIEVAENLTFPEPVTSFNYERLSDLVDKGKANFVIRNEGKTRINLKYAMYRKGTDLLYGDKIIRDRNYEIEEDENGFVDVPVLKCIDVKSGIEQLMEGDRVVRNGKLLEDIVYPVKKSFKLKEGDIVERQIQNHDFLL